MAHLHISNTVIPDRRLPLPGRVVVLGRSIDVDVPVPHRSVSRQHALIEETEEGFLISDLGSSNGTFVGEERLAEGERRAVVLGTPFRLGEVGFRLAPDEVLDHEPVLAAAPAPAPVPAPSPASPAPVKVDVTPTKKPAARSTAQRPGPRARATPIQRAVKRKAHKDAMRWLGVIVTISLLAVAGLLLNKILGMNGDEPPPDTAAEEKEERKEDPGLKLLKDPSKLTGADRK
jgi:hypothetical protein